MSFSLTSKNITVDQNAVLSATCTDLKGNPRNSSLDLNGCIGNIDGFFEWGGNSVSHSAQDLKMIDNTLMGQLQKYDQSWVPASINLDEHIRNDNGVLKYA